MKTGAMLGLVGPVSYAYPRKRLGFRRTLRFLLHTVRRRQKDDPGSLDGWKEGNKRLARFSLGIRLHVAGQGVKTCATLSEMSCYRVFGGVRPNDDDDDDSSERQDSRC